MPTLLVSDTHTMYVCAPLLFQKPLRRIVIDEIAGQVGAESGTVDNVTETMAGSSSSKQPETAAVTGCSSKQPELTRTSSNHSRVHGSDESRQESNENDVSPVVSHPGQRGPEETSPADSGDGVSELPPPPETTFEFQSQWKKFRSNRPLLVEYFKVCL